MTVALDAMHGVRGRLSLDGTWSFVHETDGLVRQASIPNPWQAEFAALRHASGTARYSRTFAVPESWKSRELAVQFGAVSYFAEVRLNGELLGTHEGGYLPFEFILPPENLKDANTLEVTVTLPTADSTAYPDFPFAEIPHGKQSWYGPLAGIWQSVTLEARDACHVVHVGIEADPGTGAIRIALEVSRGEALAVATLLDPRGNGIARTEGTELLSLRVEKPELWTPANPNLYTARIALLRGDDPVDVTEHRFGFRSIDTRDGKFFLNGEPLYIRAALDQDYYPEGICTPPSLAFIEDQFRKAKELGLNMLRCHIKVPDPRYYEVADRMGMLIWTEIPNVAQFTAEAGRRLRETMQGILRRDGNHPSIVIWTIINEDWGTRLIGNADHRTWLKESYDWLKRLDPTRLVVDNSACIPNFHVKTDINDYHYYRSVPERRAEWDKLTEEFAAASDWTWTPFGDGERRGDEPLVVSEFGVWGLPRPSEVRNAAGQEPWWFETGGDWGDGAAYLHGIENRFAAFHLDAVFGSFENFITAAQWFQFANLKYEIETMRAHAAIQGYVITEMTDVHWEANGLLDLNRNPRVFHERFRHVNADTIIVPQLEHHAACAGGTIDLGVKIATGGADLPEGATLAWSFEGASGSLDVPRLEALEVVDLGRLDLAVAAGGSRMAKVALRLSAGGAEVARNEIEIAIYGVRQPPAVTIHPKSPELSAFVQALGYRLADAGGADIILAHALDEADIEAMRNGARYLVLADGTVPTQRNLRTDPPQPEPPTMPDSSERARHLGAESQLPNIGLVQRDGTLWRGDWIANFSWLKRAGAFASLPGGPMLDISFDRVVPYHVMTGFRAWEYSGLVDAGVVIGWVHKPAVTIGRRVVGKGGLVATTFRLLQDAPGSDPVAAALLDGLIAVAAGLNVEV